MTPFSRKVGQQVPENNYQRVRCLYGSNQIHQLVSTLSYNIQQQKNAPLDDYSPCSLYCQREE